METRRAAKNKLTNSSTPAMASAENARLPEVVGLNGRGNDVSSAELSSGALRGFATDLGGRGSRSLAPLSDLSRDELGDFGQEGKVGFHFGKTVFDSVVKVERESKKWGSGREVGVGYVTHTRTYAHAR